MSETIVGKVDNPTIDEFKKRGWKYREAAPKSTGILVKNDWRKYLFIDGELVENENGLWAKDPDVLKVEGVFTLDKSKPFMQHCRGGGSVYEQDKRFFDGKGHQMKGFKLNW